MGMEHSELEIECETSQHFNIREDFDDLLQYDGGRVEASTDDTTGPKSDLPQFYHNRIALESDSPQNGHPKAPQLVLVQKNFPTSVNTLTDSTGVRELVDTPSPSVGTAIAASTNNLNQNLTQESFEVSDSEACGRVCGEESLLDLLHHPPASPVELEMQEEEEVVQDAVDLDSFVNKEVLELLQELRREAALKEGSHPVFIKGMVRIGDIDVFFEDGVQLDFAEELLEADPKSHTRSSRII